MTKRFLAFPGVVIAIVMLGGQSTSASSLTDADRRQIYSLLENVASEFSLVLAEREPRDLFAKAAEVSIRKNVVILRDFLAAAARYDDLERMRDRILLILDDVAEVETRLDASGLIPRLEAKVPVPGHRDRMTDSDRVYVVPATLLDESEVKRLTGYSKGKASKLSPEKPPEIPTVVLVPAEERSVDRAYPLETSDGPATEEPEPARIVDDFFGIYNIYLCDDHESWVSGNAEIYVKIRRSYGAGIFDLRVVNLPGVDHDKTWYTLGVGNATYTFVRQGLAASIATLLGFPTIVGLDFEFWEADAGAHGADDFVGSVRLSAEKLNSLPFHGLTQIGGSWSHKCGQKNPVVKVDRD